MNDHNPFDCNLSSDALWALRFILKSELQEMSRITKLCMYPDAISAGERNCEQLRGLIGHIERILNPAP